MRRRNETRLEPSTSLSHGSAVIATYVLLVGFGVVTALVGEVMAPESVSGLWG